MCYYDNLGFKLYLKVMNSSHEILTINHQSNYYVLDKGKFRI